MKTYRDLFDRICTFENFQKAYKNAVKGKSHYKDVKMIRQTGVNKYLRSLLDEVRSKQYKVSPYINFQLYTGHKWREISKLPMKDRIVQHAIMIYLEPIFRETFIVDTYSSIKYRGIHRGLARVRKVLREYDYKYYLKLDVHKCYPSLDQGILKQKLAEKFKDKDLLWLLYEIVDSCPHGVPIGNYTSQYFNNFYFSEFDHWMKEEKHLKGYFRYCDDMVILGNSKEELRELCHEISKKMQELHVCLKANWQIYQTDVRGVDFLGYVIRKDYTRIRKSTKHNFIEKVQRMNLLSLSDRDINVLGSYWGILKHADCRRLWLKYTKVRKFSDLSIKVHDRAFMRDLLGIPLVVSKAVTFKRRGTEWLKLTCSYEAEGVVHEDVFVSTSAEKLVEAGRQLTALCYPFETVVRTDENGFYEFS